MKNKFVAVLATMALALTGLLVAAPASAVENLSQGDDSSNPIILTSLDDVPEGAVSTGAFKRLCAAVQTWSLTTSGDELIEHPEYRYLREVPVVEEVSHLEYQWSIYSRAYNPGQQEASHQVYSYVKTVQDTKTQWYFVKFTHTKTQPLGGEWSDYGPWTQWSPISHESWEDNNVDGLGSPAFHGEGVGWYREWQARNTGETREVPNGSHQEFSGEVLAPLGAPWVLLSGYPKTVNDQVYIAPSFTPWVWSSFTPWQTSATPPVDPDIQAGEGNPLNLLQVGEGGPGVYQREVITTVYVPGYTEYYVLDGEPSLIEADASWVTADQTPEGWEQFDTRTVTDQAVTPDIVTYYEYSDGVQCPVVPGELEETEVLGGGETVVPPPVIVVAGAAVPVAASPRFTG